MRFTFFNLIFLVSFVHLLTTVPALGQETGLATLEGTVLDAETKKPVTGALITVEAIVDGRFFQTYRIGPTGSFKFLLDPKKNYYILAAAAGYRPAQEKFIISSPYTFHVSGKMILLKKGESVTASASPIPGVAQIAPADSSTSQTAPVKPIAITPPPVATAPVPSTTTAVPATTTHPEPAKPAAPSTAAVAPPLSDTARTGSANAPRSAIVTPVKPIPAPPVTAQAVRRQLQAMQFVQSKAELMAESQPALDQLLTFMRENSTTSIELAGHTDNQGNFEENLTLSKRRVELVKTFLVTNGIAADRINSRGYGSTRPIASNNSEATRRLNRRVELLILTK